MASTQKGRGAAKQELTLPEEILLLVVLAVSVLLFLSGFGIGGRLTNTVSEILFGLFGFMAYIFPILLFLCVFFIVAGENTSKMVLKVCASAVAYLALCIFSQVLLSPSDNTFSPQAISSYYSYSQIFKRGGGIFGAIVFNWLDSLFGRVGSGVLCVLVILLCFIVITKKSIFKRVLSQRQKRAERAKGSEAQRKREAARKKKQAQEKKAAREKRRQDNYEFHRKEKEIAYRAKQEERRQYLEEMEERRKQAAAENRRRRQKEEEKHRLERQHETNRDAVFTVTDLKGQNAQKAETNARRTTKAAKQKQLADPPVYGQNTVHAPEKEQEFTITRGGSVQMYKLEEPDASPETVTPSVTPKRTTLVPAKTDTGTDEPTADSHVSAKIPDADGMPEMKEKVTKADAKKAFGEVSREIARGEQRQSAYVYKAPPLSLLQKGNGSVMGDSDAALQKTARKLQQTLGSFGVNVSVLDVSCGPAVTRYELQPEVGVKVSRIVSLADDIKLNLAVSDIRIEAPIPGKPAVGIEVPNKRKSMVYLRELLESRELREQKSLLAFAAGKDISGKVIVADLAKMPHMLVAGTTGSGKSVFTNTIILSMLYRARPDEVRFIIIDPKVVEFGVYNGIPHLMIPVVTDPKKAAGALNWAVSEMAERYKKFADMHVRDINGYNAKAEALLKTPPAEGEIQPVRLPRIVIIIDELADLMMVAAKEVEDAICRLAQLARAAGIHMIVATQRPSVDVVTGLIKANIPSRVALTVASGVDSRTILDMNGAEKLLGNGDMLFYPSGIPKPIRVQGAFVTDEEVAAIVDFLKTQNQSASYDRAVEEKVNRMQASAGVSSAAESGSTRDEYFADAGKFIIEKDKASIGTLQRVFRVGFNRAARIMDQLCEAGVVGQEEGTKPRKILMSRAEFEAFLAGDGVQEALEEK